MKKFDLFELILNSPAFASMAAKLAPVHNAEWYIPQHDISMNLLEARRGRGKSLMLSRVGYRLMAENKQRWLANFRVDRHLVALRLCQEEYFSSYHEARQFAEEHVIYSLEIDEYMTAYNCIITWDECNRSLNAYDRTKEAMPGVVHEWLQQCRKIDQTIWFAVQYMDWIKPQVRMLFDRLWRAKVVRDENRKPIRFNYYGSDPYAHGVDSVSRASDYRMRYDFDIRFARMYNSWEIIEPVKMETRYQYFGQVVDTLIARGFRPRELPEYLRANRELYAALALQEVLDGAEPNADLAARMDAPAGAVSRPAPVPQKTPRRG